jgi:hypothetical protein
MNRGCGSDGADGQNDGRDVAQQLQATSTFFIRLSKKIVFYFSAG